MGLDLAVQTLPQRILDHFMINANDINVNSRELNQDLSCTLVHDVL